MNARGQIAIEYMATIGILLVMLAALIAYSFSLYYDLFSDLSKFHLNIYYCSDTDIYGNIRLNILFKSFQQSMDLIGFCGGKLLKTEISLFICGYLHFAADRTCKYYKNPRHGHAIST